MTSETLPTVGETINDEPELMSAEEYASIAEHLPEGPYRFALTHERGTLRYIGMQHTSDPEDPTLLALEQEFYNDRPTDIFVEGVSAVEKYDPKEIFTYLRTMSREEVISRHGESMFTLWLAAQYESEEHTVRIHSPEPEFEDEIAAIEHDGYSHEEILSYHIHRLVAQYMRQGGTPEGADFMRYIRPHIDEFKKLAEWSDEEVEALAGSIVESIDLESPENSERLSDPIPWKDLERTRINEVAARTSRFRDSHIVKKISEQAGTNALVVYGLTHAVMQEPALRQVLEKKD